VTREGWSVASGVLLPPCPLPLNVLVLVLVKLPGMPPETWVILDRRYEEKLLIPDHEQYGLVDRPRFDIARGLCAVLRACDINFHSCRGR
jgi:hypothetical protein